MQQEERRARIRELLSEVPGGAVAAQPLVVNVLVGHTTARRKNAGLGVAVTQQKLPVECHVCYAANHVSKG